MSFAKSELLSILDQASYRPRIYVPKNVMNTQLWVWLYYRFTSICSVCIVPVTKGSHILYIGTFHTISTTYVIRRSHRPSNTIPSWPVQPGYLIAAGMSWFKLGWWSEGVVKSTKVLIPTKLRLRCRLLCSHRYWWLQLRTLNLMTVDRSIYRSPNQFGLGQANHRRAGSWWIWKTVEQSLHMSGYW